MPDEKRFSQQEDQEKKGEDLESDGRKVQHNSLSEAENNNDASLVFAKYLSFPHWPANIISHEGPGVNVVFADGSTSGTGGGVGMNKVLPTAKNQLKLS